VESTRRAVLAEVNRVLGRTAPKTARRKEQGKPAGGKKLLQ
jgi:hypothetical protein